MRKRVQDMKDTIKQGITVLGENGQVIIIEYSDLLILERSRD